MKASELFQRFLSEGRIDKDSEGRWVRGISEMVSGYSVNPQKLLSKRFSCDSDEMVVVKDLPFVSLCEHHLFPFTGSVKVGYIPTSGEVVGLSKLARLVDCFAQRLQVQERMTRQISEAIAEFVSPDAACVVEGQHSCMSCRGVAKPGVMVTSSLLGRFRVPEVRAEFLSL